MTEPNLLKLAKKGNAKALTAILNQSLQPQNITAKVNRKDDYLQILLESVQTPDQEAMVSFIRKGLIKLEIESIQTVKVYGRKTGEESPAWSKKIELVSPPETPSSTEPIDSENLSSYQTFRAPKRAVTPKVDDPPSTGQTDFQNPRRSSAMSMNPSPKPAIDPLSVGNVISAGVRLYRDHFKLYFGLAFTAYLWVLLPIYGWAKFSGISALISRLAYSEVIERPETVNEARSHVMPRMWSFLGAGILVFLISFGVALGAIIVGVIVFRILGGMFVAIGQNSVVIGIIGWLLLVIGFIVFIIACLRFLFRLFIVEMPLAIENNVTATSTITRSLQLTKGFAVRLQWIVFVAILVTLPISIVVQIVSSILQFVVTAVFPTDSPLFGFLNFLVVLALICASGAILTPFWQAIKAVVYYDLRTRKEGLGLEIRDSR
jgi:hypothetical protein